MRGRRLPTIDGVDRRLLRQRYVRELQGNLGCDLLVKHRFKTQREAALSVFDFIDDFYNPRRRHTSIGNISPVEYGRRMSQASMSNP
jgi:transposase InsO family protein